jgi:hypothetical protein
MITNNIRITALPGMLAGRLILLPEKLLAVIRQKRQWRQTGQDPG